MPQHNDEKSIHQLVEQFKAGAILYHQGLEDEKLAVQRRGQKAVLSAIQELDAFGPEGRNNLIPLLDHPDPGVRVYAAGTLVKVIPERALAVLKEIDDFGMTRAHMTAFHMLWSHTHGGLKL
ncbi:MAG TPA: HEAT repeat domain-containing protein [Aliidongia sp.]|nr:HEAT repeat domain-containing protein [Aliidongia sp.]